MGCGPPYGLAATVNEPGRPVVALIGDGAIRMNGLLALITVAVQWRTWPRFVVLMLHNGDLNAATWEEWDDGGVTANVLRQRSEGGHDADRSSD